MSRGIITVGDVAAKTNILVIKCSKCDRVARCSLHMLIQRHGAKFPIPSLLQKLSADCPKRDAVNVYDLCGIKRSDNLCSINCPDLARLFLPAQQG
jgi:hypothetical protein